MNKITISLSQDQLRLALEALYAFQYKIGQDNSKYPFTRRLITKLEAKTI